MKRIFNFTKFIKEALKDEIPEHQKDILKNNILQHDPDDNDYSVYDIDADDILDSDVPKKTDNITDGLWKLSEEDKDRAIQIMFNINISSIEDSLKEFKPSDRLLNIIKLSYIPNEEINITKPSIKDIKMLYGNNFRMLNINETKGDRKMKRDENGLPMKNGLGFVYDEKLPGEPVFTDNKSNINALFTGYYNCYNEIINNPYVTESFKNIYSRISDVTRSNFDIDILNKFDLELYVSSKAEDILNMSLSAFYDSCQNMYDGGYRYKLPSNIFDKNCKICFLRFNTPFTDKMNNVIPFTPFSRCLIRDIKGKLYFESAYPKMSNMKDFHHKMIEKYTTMKNTYKGDRYFYKNVKGLATPYMDTLGIEELNPVLDDSKAILLSKELNLDIEYITKVRPCEYSYIDEEPKTFYVFDITKDETTIIDKMLSTLKQNFTELYPVDDWAHYINMDKFKVDYSLVTHKTAQKYDIDISDVEAEDVYKYLITTNRTGSLNPYFYNYINRKFYDKILLDWKNQVIRVLGSKNKEIRVGNYLIIQKS